MSDELKRCPFCSGKRVDYDSVLFTQKGKVIYAKCPDCGASFRVLEHMYNSRPIEDKLAAEISRLTSDLTNGRELLAMALAEGERLNAEIESLRLQLELYQDYE